MKQKNEYRQIIKIIHNAAQLYKEDLVGRRLLFQKPNVFTVTHIFSKPNSQKKYDRLLYIDKNSPIENLPSEIKEILSDDLTALGTVNN